MAYILGALVVIAALLGAVFLLPNESVAPVNAPAETEKETSQNTQDTNPPTVAPANQGQSLDLSGQSLAKTPESVFSQINLESLDLSHNKLDGALQAEVRHLQNLRMLDLSDNNFTGVPAEVGQLSQLEVLDLSNNPLTGLPYEIGNLKNLILLDLRGTQYSPQDLDVIRQGLSSKTEVRVD